MQRIKIGVIGCGAIAQIQHMPNLAELHDLFDVRVVCDISPTAAAYVAARFHVPTFVTDYRELLDADIDAVLHCASGYKTGAVVAAFDAGKHVFVEKPMCYSLGEADWIIGAQARSGMVGQVGYMKVYDPAFEYARRAVDEMRDIRFVQVNHLHPDNALHLGQFRLRRFDDVPIERIEAARAADRAARRDAIGDAPPHVQRAFGVLSGSMIHDLYGMRTILGLPDRVVSADIWQDGSAITFTLAYPNGAHCVASWVDLPDLWDFRETLEVYGSASRVLLSYPTGFARGILSEITVHSIDVDGTTCRTEPSIGWESAFVAELRHFHACVVDGTPCRTSVASARDDIALIIDIARLSMA